MMYGYGDWGPWGWVAMGVVMLLFWGGVIAVVVLLVRGPRWNSGYRSSEQDDPARILAQRFARGEIDETEYTTRLGALHQRR